MEYPIKHTHNGRDSEKIDLSNSFFKIMDTVPTHEAKEGTVVLYHSGSTYRIYAMINGDWRVTTLS